MKVKVLQKFIGTPSHWGKKMKLPKAFQSTQFDFSL